MHGIIDLLMVGLLLSLVHQGYSSYSLIRGASSLAADPLISNKIAA